MNAVELKNVTKRYKDFTLEDVSFVVPEGKIVGLVGENGAGKTTLIRAMMGSCKINGGSITVLGSEVRDDNHFAAVKQAVGVVLDEGCLPMLKLSQMEGVFKAAYINWNHEVYERLVKNFELPMKKKLNVVSRGQKMKLALALALSHKAKLLVLDEPTGGLDPLVRDEIVETLHDFASQDGHSVLFSSHIISDIEKIADYVAYIHKGRLLFFEEKSRLMEQVAQKGLATLEDYIVQIAKENKKHESIAY